jgi:hypothetical protein
MTNVSYWPQGDLPARSRALYCCLYSYPARHEVHATHDRHTVYFYEGTHTHAFYTSSDRVGHPKWKDVLATDRVERMQWIQGLVSGGVQGVDCWEETVNSQGVQREKRLYVSHSEPYVVWLEPGKEGKFKFRSAYPCTWSQVRGYTSRMTKIWPKK